MCRITLKLNSNDYKIPNYTFKYIQKTQRRQFIKVTWFYSLDTLAIFLLVTTRADAHVAAVGVDTLLVLLGAHRVRLGTLIHICGQNMSDFIEDTLQHSGHSSKN